MDFFRFEILRFGDSEIPTFEYHRFTQAGKLELICGGLEVDLIACSVHTLVVFWPMTVVHIFFMAVHNWKS